MRRFTWPIDSQPIVEVDGRWRTAAREAALMAETKRLVNLRFAAAETWQDLCELAAQFCEGKLKATPDHGGPRCAETVPIAAELAHANRQGFLTIGSQSGEDKGLGWARSQQKAAVEGYASPSTAAKLRKLVEGTRLEIKVAERPARRTDYSQDVPVTRALYPNGDEHVHTHFGAVVSQRERYVDLGRPDITDGALFVAIIDPEWGDHRLLWDRLGQPDWDNPTPPTETPMPAPEKTQPPEPPVGTILETRDSIDEYRIERTRGGWALQYREGENEFGQPLTNGRISWGSAWRAWLGGGSQPVRQVQPGDPPLPPYEEEDDPYAGMGADASNQKLDPPSAAQPWSGKGADVNEATKGAVEGVSQITPTRLALTALSRVTGQNIKPPLATAATGGGTSGGGTGVSHAEEGNAQIQQAGRDIEEAMGAIQEIVSKLEAAQQNLTAAAENSQHSEADTAMGALQEAVSAASDMQQQVGAAKQAVEDVRL